MHKNYWSLWIPGNSMVAWMNKWIMINNAMLQSEMNVLINALQIPFASRTNFSIKAWS